MHIVWFCADTLNWLEQCLTRTSNQIIGRINKPCNTDLTNNGLTNNGFTNNGLTNNGLPNNGLPNNGLPNTGWCTLYTKQKNGTN